MMDMHERDAVPYLVEVGIASLKIVLPLAVCWSLLVYGPTSRAIHSAPSDVHVWVYAATVFLGWIAAFTVLPRTRWRTLGTRRGVRALFRLGAIALALAVLGVVTAETVCNRRDGVEQRLGCKLYSESLVLCWCLPVSGAGVWLTHIARRKGRNRRQGKST